MYVFSAELQHDPGIRVLFVEEHKTRTVSRSKSWKLRSVNCDDIVYDTVTVGEAVMAYWSPMETFYEARVVEVPLCKFILL